MEEDIHTKSESPELNRDRGGWVMSTLSFTRRGNYTSIFMGVRVPQSLRTRLEDLAEIEGVTLSEVVRVLLEAGLTLAQENTADQALPELSPK